MKIFPIKKAQFPRFKLLKLTFKFFCKSLNKFRKIIFLIEKETFSEETINSLFEKSLTGKFLIKINKILSQRYNIKE